MIARNDSAYPTLERLLNLLNPWLIYLNPGGNNVTDSLDEDQSNFLLEQLFRTEYNMTAITVSRGKLDLAEGHCQRCLAYLKRLNVEGEMKTTSIFEALSIYSHLRQQHGKDSDAIVFAEEC
jgi:hypothetical protein